MDITGNVTRQEFQAFTEVQMSGEYNMYMERMYARQEAGIDEDTYDAILKNYSELAEKYEEK